jgi:hypothetical protein
VALIAAFRRLKQLGPRQRPHQPLLAAPILKPPALPGVLLLIAQNLVPKLRDAINTARAHCNIGGNRSGYRLPVFARMDSSCNRPIRRVARCRRHRGRNLRWRGSNLIRPSLRRRPVRVWFSCSLRTPWPSRSASAAARVSGLLGLEGKCGAVSDRVLAGNFRPSGGHCAA